MSRITATTSSGKTRTTCVFFAKSNCRYGDKCKFSHKVSPTQKRTPVQQPSNWQDEFFENKFHDNDEFYNEQRKKIKEKRELAEKAELFLLRETTRKLNEEADVKNDAIKYAHGNKSTELRIIIRVIFYDNKLFEINTFNELISGYCCVPWTQEPSSPFVDFGMWGKDMGKLIIVCKICIALSLSNNKYEFEKSIEIKHEHKFENEDLSFKKCCYCYCDNVTIVAHMVKHQTIHLAVGLCYNCSKCLQKWEPLRATVIPTVS